VNGYYEYSVTLAYGAPVYTNKGGWNLHRDKPAPVETILTDNEVREFGWVISKDRKPWYGSKTDELIAPKKNWQPFYGPMPPPSQVTSISWEKHLFEVCGPLKDAGNTAIQNGMYEQAVQRYSNAILQMDGYSDVVDASVQLQQLQISLYANRAEAYVRLQKWKQALEDSRWVLERDPAHAKAGFRLAKACKALDRWDEAVGPLEKLLEAAGPQGNTEVRTLLTEAEVIAKCKSGESKLSGVYIEIKWLQDEVNKLQAGTVPDDVVIAAAAQTLTATLGPLLESVPHDDVGLRRDILLMFKSVQLFDTILSLALTVEDTKEYPLLLMAAYLWPYADEKEMKRLLESLRDMSSSLITHSTTALVIVSKLLKHRQRKSLRIADQIIETPGLLAKCLRRWAERLDEIGGRIPDQAAAEVFKELEAQCLRLDNLEALSLAFFVECFIGERTEDGITGGFLLYHGWAVRQVVLSSLRRWSEDKRVLKSLRPSLVARAWGSVSTKLRRDATVEREKQIGPSDEDGNPIKKIEWFKLKPPAKLRRDIGAFFAEDFLEAFLDFLKAHFEATCERGFEAVVEDGIAPRPPPEEWVQEIIDEPFAWGLLLPLVIGPPSIASRTASLLETIIDKYPHNEKLANKLAGMQVFMPLISFPWPPTNTARSYLKETRALSSKVRRSLLTLLRCCIDTPIALRVVKVDLDTCMQAVFELLKVSLMDKDEPACVISALEIVGIIITKAETINYLTEELVFDVLKEFMRNNHTESRSQLAKFLRLVYNHQEVKVHLQKALEDERLCLNDEQRGHVMREIFDHKTLAGQFVAQKMMETSQKMQEMPSDVVHPDEKRRQQVKSLVDAIAEAYIKPDARVLVMGRIARSLCKCLAERQNPCKIILGDTTLEKLDTGELGSAVETVLLPVPKAIDNDAVLASQEHWDLVITGEPMGYFDVGEYADKLRPFINRREEEDERVKDQVQWVCVETAERIEDARDEVYAGGYYSAEHDKAYEKLRSLARAWQHDLTLFSLPSYEKERRKKHEQEKATERYVKREAEEAAKEKQEEENEQRRGVLNEALFDPLLSVPEVSSLPVLYELGVEQGAADVILFWLHANDEDAEVYRPVFEEVIDSLCGNVRIVVPTFPESRSSWYPWSDQLANNMGMEWYELQDDPTDEAAARAKKDPARHASFKPPTLEELQCLEEMEVCVKQLLNLAEEEVFAGMPEDAKIAFGGFSQGGSVAAYAAASNTASEDLKPFMQGLIQICAGVPVFQFLASKMQQACLKNREAEIFEQPMRVHMIYSEKDPEIKPTFVSTMKDLYKRFDYPVTLTRFQSTPEERLPRELQNEVFLRALRPFLPAMPMAG